MYKKNRKRKDVRGLKWFGSILLLTGLCFTSFNIYPLNLYFMTIGSVVWVSVGYYWKDGSIILLNSVGFIISVVGLMNFWT
jgi:predicted anti-sigma-YlaC factor YlaD